MNVRRLTSLTAFISFFVVLFTSVILYIVPHGRVAYWAEWRLWGLSKEEWGAIHINTGFLFLLFLLFHIYYNWKPITSYLKDKKRHLKGFTREFNVSLMITLVVVAGTYFEVPPFSTVIAISDGFKKAASVKYGEPPYGHAELSTLKSFSQKMNLDLEKGLRLIKNAGIDPVDETMTLKEIAALKRVPPQKIYDLLKPAEKQMPKGRISPADQLPETPAPGTGNMRLQVLCEKFQLDRGSILHGLEKMGIQAGGEETIKQIAEKHQMSPSDLYDKIKIAAHSQPKG